MTTKTFGSVTLFLAHLCNLGALYATDPARQRSLVLTGVAELSTKLAQPRAQA